MPFVYLTLYVAKTLSINVPIIAMLESCSLNMAFLLIQHEFIVLVLWSLYFQLIFLCLCLWQIVFIGLQSNISLLIYFCTFYCYRNWFKPQQHVLEVYDHLLHLNIEWCR